MKKSFLGPLLLIIITTSCIGLKPSVSSSFTKAAPIATKQALIETSTPATIVNHTDTMTLAPEQDIISPQLVNICLENPEVSFEELELPRGFHLLLLSSTVKSSPPVPAKPMSISFENPSPTPIFGNEIFQYSVSPDHKWIYFDRPGANNNHSMLWISSLDGEKQWPVIELYGKDYAGYASWVFEQEIFIIGSPNKDELSTLDPWEYMPFISVNPFTLEHRQLTYLAGDQKVGLYYYGSISMNGRTFGMYGRLNRVDFIYDFDQDKNLPVFSWLDSVDPFDMQVIKPIWVYDENKIAVTIAHPYGIDLAFNLDIQSASKIQPYNEVMKRVLLPERLLPISMLGVAPGKNLIAFQRFDHFNSAQGENWFYALDYNNEVVIDYCFDLQDSVEQTSFSPDGRFVAFSLADFSADLESDKHYVAIFDLHKGVVAYLRGYTAVGWGIMP